MAPGTGILIRAVWGLGLLLLLWGFLRFFEWKNIYYPSRKLMATPADFGVAFEDVQFLAEDGVRLHGWWVPHPAASGALLYFHGNAGNIGDRAEIVSDLHRLGVQVFIFDYRGYGNSHGWPSEQGTYRDARAAYEVIRARYDDAERPPVVVYGRSLGGAMAVQLALDRPVRALVLEGAFTSTVDMARRLVPWYPARWMVRYRYDSAAKLPRVAIPKLIAHGRQDETVPFEMGRRLYDVAAEPKQFYELPGGHNDIAWAQDRRYWEVLEQFVRQNLPPKQ